ncbi:zinc finger protein 835-like isoform X4 [Pundamilia nyererei]|uniref:Zinc finger protein 835-like isoform X4 n=1 Tax=Pundamilia nyererei TaxID=303518 RepID=A0A9Y3VSL1_9CICH|nr:PREDICTED: zinc finger protein 835-like isoform X4 [Pundamilia nyererei]XP_014196639.1 zinc finger protein 646 isoform X4 [Haplochromis burtoni]XP_039905137.1 zinc finger protein 646-like isoform X4 [Simochromis diagramma]
MYARTNTSSTHGDFQDRNGVNYVTSTESFGHCSQLFWKKDPNDSGPSSTISWCDQLPSSSAALSTSSLSSASLSSSSLSSASLSSSRLSMESQAPAPAPPPATTVSDDMESDERPYVCDLCSCAYKHASSLLNHKLTHKTGDFRCDFCSKPYTNYMSLRNHMRIHGQKRYMCDLCGKAFRLARYLRNHQRIHDDGPNRFDCPSCCKSYRTMLELAQHRCSAAASNQSGGRRSNFSATPRRQQQQQQQQQNNANSMMQPHGGHGQPEPLPSHCVSPMSQGGQGGGVASQSVPDPHQQGRPSSVSSQASQQNMRSSSSNKHVSSSSATPSSSYSLLQPLVPEVKEMSSGYTRLSANPMPKHQDTFSLPPQRPLTTINPIGHSLHPNGAPTLKPSPVPRTIQAMPWEQRSLYNQ